MTITRVSGHDCDLTFWLMSHYPAGTTECCNFFWLVLAVGKFPSAEFLYSATSKSVFYYSYLAGTSVGHCERLWGETGCTDVMLNSFIYWISWWFLTLCLWPWTSVPSTFVKPKLKGSYWLPHWGCVYWFFTPTFFHKYRSTQGKVFKSLLSNECLFSFVMF